MSKQLHIPPDGKRPSSEDEKKLYSYVTERAKSKALEIGNIILEYSGSRGGLVLVHGSMNAGKSIVVHELDGLLKDKLGEDRICVAQPAIERSDIIPGKVFSRNGLYVEAISYATTKDVEKMFHDHDVVIIDEFHITPESLQSIFQRELLQFVDRGGWAVMTGLLKNALNVEFLLSWWVYHKADYVYQLVSTCQMCGRRNAVHNQRLVNGVPASYHDPVFAPPSDEVVYEPRCDDCYVTKG